MEEEEGPAEECEVCGGTNYYKEAGNFYCNECQTQSQQIREQLFEQEETAVNKKSTKKIQKDKNQKLEDKLTSWECYNIILKGLTEELIGLGAKPEVKSVVRCLWMKYLHKCEVFDLKSNRAPKVSILGSRKDIEILYNVKKRKRPRSRTSSTSTTLSVRRQRSSKKRALIHSQYEELSQSQSLTQDSSVANQTLSSLKTGSEKSDSSGEIKYNRYSNAQLKRIMSKNHHKEHKHDVDRAMSCHKFSSKKLPEAFVRGPTVLTPFTIYSILYIGLLIVEDTLQLGDMLRFIREGHLSFGSYRHFFDEDMSDKSLNLPRKNEKIFNSRIFMRRTADLVHFLKIETYIKRPNLAQLCFRYCEELNLPRKIYECVEKLIVKTAPQMAFGQKSRTIPNYEGRAMSFILFTLKLLCSLDGVTENKFSDYAKMLNNLLTDKTMFDFLEWLKYIGCRDLVIKTHHMPSSLQNSDNVDSDMYLEYFRNQEINFKGVNKRVQNEVKEYLQIFDKVLENDGQNFGDEAKFKHSLTPYLSYINFILHREDIAYDKVLERSFSEDLIDFLLRPNEYLKVLGNETVRNGGANENFVIEDALYIEKDINEQMDTYNNSVAVKISEETVSDKFIKEYLDLNNKASLKHTDIDVFLSNWQESNKKQFKKNKVLLKIASDSDQVNVKSDCSDTEVYAEHYNAFERYWLNIPTNPANYFTYISKSRVEQILSKLPYSFTVILKELTRIVEQDLYDFYSEFLVTELNLVYFEGYCSKGKNRKVPGIQRVLRVCRKKW